MFEGRLCFADGFPGGILYAIMVPVGYDFFVDRAGDVVDFQSLIVIIVGLIIISLMWKVIKGVVRLVLTVGVVLIILYVVLNILR